MAGRSARRLPGTRLLPGLTLWVAACQSVLGIEDWSKLPEAGGENAGGASGASSKADAGDEAKDRGGADGESSAGAGGDGVGPDKDPDGGSAQGGMAGADLGGAGGDGGGAAPRAEAGSGGSVGGGSTCANGFADCDADPNTCETDLNLVSACGTTCEDRVPCSTNNATSTSCEDGRCVPVCNPGYGDCTGENDGCETRLDSVESCGVCGGVIRACNSDQVCQDGLCVENAPYDLGESSTDGWAPFTPVANRWYIVKVRVPRDADVLALRLIGRSNQGVARMALWEDEGGQPGEFVAQSDEFDVAAGVRSAEPRPVATRVEAGKDYWLGAVFELEAELYSSTATGNLVFTFEQLFSDNPATTLAPFPASSAQVGAIENMALNFFLLLQDTPS